MTMTESAAVIERQLVEPFRLKLQPRWRTGKFSAFVVGLVAVSLCFIIFRAFQQVQGPGTRDFLVLFVLTAVGALVCIAMVARLLSSPFLECDGRVLKRIDGILKDQVNLERVTSMRLVPGECLWIGNKYGLKIPRHDLTEEVISKLKSVAEDIGGEWSEPQHHSTHLRKWSLDCVLFSWKFFVGPLILSAYVASLADFESAWPPVVAFPVACIVVFMFARESRNVHRADQHIFLFKDAIAVTQDNTRLFEFDDIDGITTDSKGVVTLSSRYDAVEISSELLSDALQAAINEVKPIEASDEE